MSGMTSIKKEYFKTDKDNTFVYAHLYFDLGGHNWANGSTEKRGYRVSFGIVEAKQCFDAQNRACGVTTKENPRDGYRVFLKEVGRRSARASEEVALKVDEIKAAHLQTVAMNNGVKVIIPLEKSELLRGC